MTGACSFEFLNSHLVLLPIIETKLSRHNNTESGTAALYVVDCSQPIAGRLKYHDIPRVARFSLPALKDGFIYSQIYAVSSAPETQHDIANDASPLPHPDWRLLGFQVVITLSESSSPYDLESPSRLVPTMVASNQPAVSDDDVQDSEALREEDEYVTESTERDVDATEDGSLEHPYDTEDDSDSDPSDHVIDSDWGDDVVYEEEDWEITMHLYVHVGALTRHSMHTSSDGNVPWDTWADDARLIKRPGFEVDWLSNNMSHNRILVPKKPSGVEKRCPIVLYEFAPPAALYHAASSEETAGPWRYDFEPTVLELEGFAAPVTTRLPYRKIKIGRFVERDESARIFRDGLLTRKPRA